MNRLLGAVAVALALACAYMSLGQRHGADSKPPSIGDVGFIYTGP